MALVLADRVQEYSTTTGTGTLTLSGAYAGFQTFAAGIGNGNTCYYTITSDKNQWEVGIGTVGIGTLARTTLISSSTGSLVSFVGTLTVFVTYPAEKAVYSDSTTIVAPAGALLPITSGGTGASTAAAARTVLGLGTIATQNADAIAVTGGAINGATVGATTVAAGSFSTLNSSGNTRLGGLSGNQSLQVNNVASAVNYAQIVGAATGAAPTISAQGSDASINLNLAAKVNGYVYTSNANGTAARFFGGLNYFTFGGSGSGSPIVLSSTGSDTNINFVVSSKGTGVVALGGSTASNSSFVATPVTSSVNWVQATGAATTAAPELRAQGSDTNINLKLTPKGTGVLQFGTYTAGILAQTGYITITDAGGTSRRLLVG